MADETGFGAVVRDPPGLDDLWRARVDRSSGRRRYPASPSIWSSQLLPAFDEGVDVNSGCAWVSAWGDLKLESSNTYVHG